jgi:2-oxoglutarate ferredoxin oxidoreductase subunit alpha
MNSSTSPSRRSVSIVIAGEAGQGIQTIEYLLAKILKLEGYHVFACKEYMSRIRGGANSTEIRVAADRVAAYTERIDLLVPLDKGALSHLRKRITPETVILGEAAALGETEPVLDIPFSAMAQSAGNKLYANSVASGAVAGIMGVAFETVSSQLEAYFASKSREIIDGNIEAARRGFEAGQALASGGKVFFSLPKEPALAGELILNGSEAAALGAVAGGCDFIASYPMSPGTGVLTYLSQYAARFGIVAEQAEDEIAAFNMALGAWYAGARAMVSTSGGGFALMTEAVSLAGMIESPMVIHLAQRPGPATGLPTRTEQGDLELALYAGHGEFPRIILAPRSIADAFYLTQHAFNLADRYQAPVFLLTDQFLVDSFANLSELKLDGLRVERQITKTNPSYRRYELTGDGISPRGIPGFGDGLVGVDSDEHDEFGHITEDLELRVQMVDKRLRKLERIKNNTIPPYFNGGSDDHTLVVGWGSTFHVIAEALQVLQRPGVAHLHFSQVYPLAPVTTDYLNRAGRIILIENNATGQFGKLIRQETGICYDERILKYDGMPFSVEELVKKLTELIPTIQI